jgi:beta-xylosidase
MAISLQASAQVTTPLASRRGVGGEAAGYLFAYFEGSGDPNLMEQLRFAVSEDARNWYALNGNRPIVASDSISESGGIRDPHILRGEDGCYYIVATDMHTYDPKQGWGANPGIVLLKSKDLVNWTHAKINLSKDWSGHFGDAYWVWAPQTIYDRKARKYMIYFTLQRNDRKTLITYYAYANKDFTAFESEPKVLFSAKYGSIDADIIEKDGVFHLFYKGNTKDENGREIKNGIQQATSKKLTGPYKEDFEYLDAYAGTRTHVEGSGVFQLNNSEDWILMYDLYSSGRYEFQRSKDLKTFTKEPESFRKDFFPRHGTVMSVTADELERLQQKWGWVLTHEFESTGNPVIRDKHTADPAVLVENDTLWLFAGHDAAGNQSGYVMKDWLLYSTTDMKHWTEYPSPLRVDDFKWADSHQAYAGHVAKGKDGRYYWYVSTNWCGIGVAVADKITGPYRDALGKPLLTNKDCFASKHSWASIDPAVLIDDDGTAYIIWGNRECYCAKLKDNMTETDGEIRRIDVPDFTEAPWMHKHNGKYYLTYASGWPEKIAYAVSDNIFGPYTPMGVISEIAGNSNTTHPAIVRFKDQWLFFSHNGGLSDGGSYSRSVIAEPMSYDRDGHINFIPATPQGATPYHHE